MRTVEIGVFSFDELGEDAKQRVKDRHAEMWGYARGDEAVESLKKLAEHFDGKLTDWEIDWFNGSYSSATFEMPEEIDVDDLAVLLGKLGSYNPENGKGHGDCELTGVFTDEAAIDGFRQHWLLYGEPNLDTLMQAAFESLLKECQEDCEYCYSDEAMGETCEANDWEFYENGKPVRKR